MGVTGLSSPKLIWLLLPLTPIHYPRTFILTIVGVTGLSSPKSGFSCPSPLHLPQDIYTHIHGCDWSLQPQVWLHLPLIPIHYLRIFILTSMSVTGLSISGFSCHSPHSLPQDIHTNINGCDWLLQPQVSLNLPLSPIPLSRIFILTSTGVTGLSSSKSGFSYPQAHPLPQGYFYSHQWV